MVQKISFEKIIVAHFATMRNNATNKPCIGDYFVFFGIPLIFSFLLWDSPKFDKDAVNALITAASIFAGLLLNLLVLIFTLIGKFDTDGVLWKKKAQLPYAAGSLEKPNKAHCSV